MITVIAGVNGAGKSSIVGEAIRAANGQYYNPDEATRGLMLKYPDWSLEQANSEAWMEGKRQLEISIKNNDNYAFETTLGGNTITQLLHNAIQQGVDIQLFYCGLDRPELHIERVKARVAKGGHDIPETKIRQRWINSVTNAASLIPVCRYVKVVDNSKPLCKKTNITQAQTLFFLNGDVLTLSVAPDSMPKWAKPLALEAFKRAQQ